MKGIKNKTTLVLVIFLVFVTTSFLNFTTTIKVCTQHTDCLSNTRLNQLHWLGISFKVWMSLYYRRAVNFTLCFLFWKSFKMFCFCIFQLKLACKYKAYELYLFSKVTKIRHGEGNGNPRQWIACRIPQTEESGRLLSMGLQRVRHDLVTKQDKAKKKKKKWCLPEQLSFSPL